MRSTSYLPLAFLALTAACASTSTPQPLPSLPPPAFAPAEGAATEPSPAPPGEMVFTVADPKAKAPPADEGLTTLQPLNASATDVKTKHVHPAQ
jgi:hypothetical protein